MNVEIGAEAAQFPEKEYINGIAFAVYVILYDVTCICKMIGNVLCTLGKGRPCVSRKVNLYV
jgi:hypothetical protein